MRKLKIYLDTSVVSHLFADDAPDKMISTNKIWDDFIADKYELFISPITTLEMHKCSEPKRSLMIGKMAQINFKILLETHEISELAFEYIRSGALTEKSFDDCLHIAYAVVYNCDIIISWNFKHLVNYKTIKKVKIVNAMNNYKEISIVTPEMLTEET